MSCSAVDRELEILFLGFHVEMHPGEKKHEKSFPLSSYPHFDRRGKSAVIVFVLTLLGVKTITSNPKVSPLRAEKESTTNDDGCQNQ